MIITRIKVKTSQPPGAREKWSPMESNMGPISQGWFFSFESDRLEKWPELAGLATVGGKTILKKFRITFDTQ